MQLSSSTTVGFVLLALGAPLAIMAIFALQSLNALVDTHRLPIVPEQRVTFDRAAMYVLSIETLNPFAFDGVSYTLQALPGGRDVESHSRMARHNAGSTGLQLRGFRVPRAGEYLLRIHNLPAAPTDLMFVFSRVPPSRGFIWGVLLFAGIAAAALGLSIVL